jgi:hypothetical protein
MIGGRLLLLCGECDGRPDSLTRLEEMVAVDWRPARATIEAGTLIDVTVD